MLCSILDKIFVIPTKDVKYKCRLKFVIGYCTAHVETSAFNVFFAPLFFKIRQGNTLRCSKIMCPVKTNNILGILIQIPKCDQVRTESRDYSARVFRVSREFLPTFSRRNQRQLAVYFLLDFMIHCLLVLLAVKPWKSYMVFCSYILYFIDFCHFH